MSIENNLASIAKSLETIAIAMSAPRRTQVVEEAAPAAPIAVPVPLPTAIIVPAAPPVLMAVPPPAAPVPAAAVSAAAVSAVPAPFADAAGLMEYVMGKYRTLGPVKGALIQNALTEVGCRNIKDVTADMYSAFFHKVEAIV